MFLQHKTCFLNPCESPAVYLFHNIHLRTRTIHNTQANIITVLAKSYISTVVLNSRQCVEIKWQMDFNILLIVSSGYTIFLIMQMWWMEIEQSDCRVPEWPHPLTSAHILQDLICSDWLLLWSSKLLENLAHRFPNSVSCDATCVRM